MSGMPGPARITPLARKAFRVFRPITTRWSDNDVFGHVNNVIYYAWFDTAVTGWLLDQGFLDPLRSDVICVVADTRCTYFRSIAFPDAITTAIAVDRLGRSSVTWRIGVFRGDDDLAAAQGSFTHVYVSRGDQKPVAIPDPVRSAMAALVTGN